MLCESVLQLLLAHKISYVMANQLCMLDLVLNVESINKLSSVHHHWLLLYFDSQAT